MVTNEDYYVIKREEGYTIGGEDGFQGPVKYYLVVPSGDHDTILKIIDEFYQTYSSLRNLNIETQIAYKAHMLPVYIDINRNSDEFAINISVDSESIRKAAKYTAEIPYRWFMEADFPATSEEHNAYREALMKVHDYVYNYVEGLLCKIQEKYPLIAVTYSY